MERINKAVEFLSQWVKVVLYELGTEQAELLANIGLPVHCNGFYHQFGERIFVKRTGRTPEEILKTLIHELGHFLVDKSILSEADVPRKYKWEVDTFWLLSYDPENREEELLVESFALWAMDSTNGKINPEFWVCLKNKLQQL